MSEVTKAIYDVHGWSRVEEVMYYNTERMKVAYNENYNQLFPDLMTAYSAHEFNHTIIQALLDFQVESTKRVKSSLNITKSVTFFKTKLGSFKLL